MMARGLLSAGGPLTGLLAMPKWGNRDDKGQVRQRGPATATGAKPPERERGVNPLRVLDGVLGGRTISESLDHERMRPQLQAQAEQQQAMQQQAMQGLLSMFGGQGQAQQGAPGMATGPMAGSAMGKDGEALMAPQTGPRGLPDLRTAAPALAAAQLAGVEGFSGLREILTGLQPDVQIGPDGTPYDANDPASLERRFADRQAVNDVIMDLNNPENEGRHIPQVAEGFELVFDAAGRPQVREVGGYTQGVASREGAIAGARAGATAPIEAAHDTITVQGPDGAPITMSRADFLGGGAIRGQSPYEAAIAEADAERAAGLGILERRTDATQTTVNNARTAITRARDLANGMSTGVGRDRIPFNQRRVDLEGQIDTLQSILSFKELQTMRDNSPTGGALGSITERELALLGSTIAALNPNMSQEQFTRSLDIVEGSLERWGEAASMYEEQQRGRVRGGDQQSRSGPRVGAVEQGYRFLGGDPANPQNWERVQ